jgi:nitroimidazol reductase NimA-like FMN-containing flavoprotein (pyridoxamine 5'-phosphate oxidase superfamily)
MQKPAIRLNQPLRKERAKDEAWIKAFLARVPLGMLATDFDGQPFIKPTSFVFAEGEGAIYIHGALVGQMRSNLERNPRVSFCVAEMGRLLPADTAMEVGVEYASVVVLGKAEVLTDAEQARHGLRLLLERYFSQLKYGVDYREILPHELDATVVYKITIESWSGKEQNTRPDFPGAFNFPAP